jgi:hypothetical protein
MLLIIAMAVTISAWLLLELDLHISFIFILAQSVSTKKATTGTESTTLSDYVSMISVACEATIRFLETFPGLDAVFGVLASRVGKKRGGMTCALKTLVQCWSCCCLDLKHQDSSVASQKILDVFTSALFRADL